MYLHIFIFVSVSNTKSVSLSVKSFRRNDLRNDLTDNDDDSLYETLTKICKYISEVLTIVEKSFKKPQIIILTPQYAFKHDAFITQSTYIGAFRPE